MQIEKYSFGMGDRFGHQGQAQLQAVVQAREIGMELTPVWNKSNREHLIVKSKPENVRQEADAAVVALDWKGPYRVDADHIGLKTVDRFIAASDFYTIDVADSIGQPVEQDETAWSQSQAHSGSHSVSVTDAAAGDIAGWTVTIPVQSNQSYAFSGWIKGGDDLASDGMLPGAILAMQFVDAGGQPLRDRILSPAVEGKTNWTRVSTPPVVPPVGAVQVRLIIGMVQCRGTAWFDDLALTGTAAQAQTVEHIKRQPLPQQGVAYADNLLANGDVETGDNGRPAHWNYMGKSARDWTPEAVKRFDDGGRAEFSVGRGRGEWSRDFAYAGKGALLNISIDPPLGHTLRWHGRAPVDGYWLSDAMPCTPGTAYLASAWIWPGRLISSSWYGPLQIYFYDAKGHVLKEANDIRAPHDGVLPGRWFYWSTMPWVAPAGATEMKLRFGQELAADGGGWGRTYADDFAVWALPADVPIPTPRQVASNDEEFAKWWRTATEKIKPPYVSAPDDAPTYDSCLGEMANTVPGNLFSDPAAKVSFKVTLTNLLGEERKVSLRITRYDWLGDAEAPVDVPPVAMSGYGTASTEFQLTGAGKLGSYYLDIDMLENGVKVGNFSGRYAVLPPRERQQTVAHGWSVTPMPEPQGTHSPKEQEEQFLLQRAGFEQVWIRSPFATWKIWMPRSR